jgi:hypothetical protein
MLKAEALIVASIPIGKVHWLSTWPKKAPIAIQKQQKQTRNTLGQPAKLGYGLLPK